MRIISGKYKGKKLEGFDIDGTRPTMDRVKESMFALIQNYIKDSIVLDLFAGSGALGIEALSNGAKECYFIDKNPLVLKKLNINIANIDNAYAINKDSLLFLEETKLKFDIIFLDPPYHDNLIEKAINKIIKNNLLNEDGIIVCEVEEEFECCLNLIKEKNYGIKKVKVYTNLN